MIDYTFNIDDEVNVLYLRIEGVLVASVDCDLCSLTKHFITNNFFISSDPISIPISSDQASYLSSRLNFISNAFLEGVN